MRIIVQGAKTESLTAKVKDAIQFYASKLLSEEMVDKIKISVEIDQKRKRRDVFGECAYHGENEVTGLHEFSIYCVHKPKSIPRIRSYIWRNLAHEMVHVKQYITGELGNTLVTKKTAGKCLTGLKWCGKIYETSISDNVKNEEYFFYPWEIEAYGLEVGLCKMWMDSRGMRIR